MLASFLKIRLCSCWTKESLERLAADRTTLIVAHRLSTITHADKIVVIDAGELKEMGTHEQLMKKQGIYYGLFQVQVFGT